jgi:hypothetical protein
MRELAYIGQSHRTVVLRGSGRGGCSDRKDGSGTTVLAARSRNAMDMLLSVAIGVGLAAATGFRVFIPLLVAGLAARADWVPLTESFAWLESTPALIALGTAALLEALAFYIPGVDHALDVLAGPLAVIAGVLASASVMADVPPEVRWPLAVIAGGGAAAATKATAALIRAKSAVMTGGLGNPVVSTAETAGAATMSVLAVLAPIICLAVAIVLLIWVLRRRGRLPVGPVR